MLIADQRDPGLDPKDVNRGGNSTVYTVAELDSLTTETPYPSAEMNSPPGGAINYTTTPPSKIPPSTARLAHSHQMF